MADDEAAERRRLIDKYRATNNEAYLRAAACLKRADGCVDVASIFLAVDSKGGRPGEDDGAMLHHCCRLMDEGASRWAAAQQIASEQPGHSGEATARRLARKLKTYKPKVYDPTKRIIEKAERHRAWFDAEARRAESRRAQLDSIVGRNTFHRLTRAFLNKTPKS